MSEYKCDCGNRYNGTFGMRVKHVSTNWMYLSCKCGRILERRVNPQSPNATLVTFATEGIGWAPVYHLNTETIA